MELHERQTLDAAHFVRVVKEHELDRLVARNGLAWASELLLQVRLNEELAAASASTDVRHGAVRA